MPAADASSTPGIPPNLLNHRRIREIGKYQPVPPSAIGQDVSLELYRQMKRLRRTEEALFNEYHPADEMRCPIHFCIGQEAIPAALSLLVQPDDFMFSHHRSHGYYFAKGSPLRELFAEIYGKETGASGGKAGSQDISHHETQFYSGAILAGALTIAAGTAFGLKHQGKKQIAISGCGEGATDEGAFWEAVNYAGRMKLPLLIVIENNRYATFSDQLKRQAEDNICERVRPFGMRATKIFGNDAVLAWQTLSAEIARVRAGEGPALVEAYTFRWNSHVGPEDDGFNNYRTDAEMKFWKDNCPISLLEQGLRGPGGLTDALLQQIEQEAAAEIAANFKFAKESPFPSDTSWRHMNWDDTSPLADKLLGTASAGTSVFDQYQAEAKLGPY
jgi:TPP-dependent pyruvate/acetoin dehydrogenase alpha subunit